MSTVNFILNKSFRKLNTYKLHLIYYNSQDFHSLIMHEDDNNIQTLNRDNKLSTYLNKIIFNSL